jgi:hypothetical protein
MLGRVGDHILIFLRTLYVTRLPAQGTNLGGEGSQTDKKLLRIPFPAYF